MTEIKRAIRQSEINFICSECQQGAIDKCDNCGEYFVYMQGKTIYCDLDNEHHYCKECYTGEFKK